MRMSLILAFFLIAAAMLFGVDNYCSSDAMLIAGAIIIAGALVSKD